MKQAFNVLGDLPPQAKVRLAKFEWELKKPSSSRADALYSSMACEVAVADDLTLGIETTLWLRDGNNAWEIDAWDTERVQERANKWLEANGITPDESRGGRKGKDRWVYASYEYTESPEVVGKEFKKLILNICQRKRTVQKRKTR